MWERIRPKEGWLTLLLPWMMVMVAALAIREAELVRRYNLFSILGLTATVGFVAGIALAKSQFPALTAHIYSLVYGLFTFAVIIGRTLAQELTWRERVTDIVTRLADWVTQVFHGSSSRDSLIIVMYTTLIFWVLGYTTAWYTLRRLHIWRVILPSGLVLLSVVYYYFGPRPLIFYLAVYAVLALLYVAQTFLVVNQSKWDQEQVRYSPHINGSFLRSSLLVALVALAVAWSLPTLAANAAVTDVVGQVNQPWREFRDWWQRGFAALDSSYTQAPADPYQASLELGGPRQVSDYPVMDVYVEQPLPYAYWRKEILDTYNPQARQWETVSGETQVHFPEEGAINTPAALGRALVSQIFVNYVPNAGTIFSTPEFLNSDRAVLIKTTLDPEGKTLVSAVRARFQMQQGDRYQVVSQFSTADAESLRQATVDYPTYIREQYLTVPAGISQRTLDLAARLATPRDNPYDKATAIQGYLRGNITYNDQTPAPPPGAEPIDYLLFVSRQGYCNYYASAMVIMLRSQGIPARLARGYAAGEYMPAAGAYRVRAKDAHTWVEAYFSEYGWIPFEPTTAIAAISRQDSALGALNDGPDFDPNDLQRDDLSKLLEEESQDTNPTNGLGERGPNTGLLRGLGRASVLVGMAVGVVGLALGAVVLARRYNRRVEGDVVKSYYRLSQWGGWLGVEIRPNQTPYERADLIIQAVPEGAAAINRLINEFIAHTFTARKQPNTFFSPAREWNRLRPLLIKRAILQRLPVWLARRLEPA